ncbi:MAG: type II secretion system protein [Phycisphaeraceae bacterium]|nr:type II secretion system protein [Phycisphaeraceae bacterium]
MNLRKTRPAFTLIELLVSIAIIALLITLVAVGVSHVSKIARGTSERQTVVALNQAVQAFKQEFGFLPPLVPFSDTVRPVEFNLSNPSVPVPNAYGSNVQGGSKSFNSNAMFLEGFQSAGNPNLGGTKMMSADWAKDTVGETWTAPDVRYSEYSLAYYLVGALGRAVDGVEGPGMFRPKTDGSFEFGAISNSSRVNDVSGRTYPAFVDTSRRSPKLDIDLATSKSKDANLTWTDPNNGNTTSAIMTRYRLIAPNGKPYRYYRWAPRSKGPIGTTQYYNPATNAFDRAENGTDLLDIPSLLGDPSTDADLRGAEYAIVSAGPDAYFGDMNGEASSADLLGEMAVRVGVKLDTTNQTTLSLSSIAVRKAARADNIVEVGR